MTQRIGLKHVQRISRVVRPFDTVLPVVSFTPVVSQWLRIGGPEPLLDSNDDAGSYIRAPWESSFAYDEYYLFDTLPYGSAKISSVVLMFRMSGYNPFGGLYADLWNGSAWVNAYYYVGYDDIWSNYVASVTSILDTLAKVNGARIRFRGAYGWGHIYITYAQLRVIGTY